MRCALWSARWALGKAMAQMFRVLSEKTSYAGNLGAIYRQLRDRFSWPDNPDMDPDMDLTWT